MPEHDSGFASIPYKDTILPAPPAMKKSIFPAAGNMRNCITAPVNTEADPFAVTPYTVKPALPENGRTKCILPPLSWNVLRFSAEGNI